MMDIEKLIEAVRLCGSTPKVDQCKQCAYWSGGDMSKCIPRMTTDAATALSTLQAENKRLNKIVCSIPTTPDSGRTVSQYDKEMSMCAYLDDLEAENEKLRAELEQKEKYYEQMIDALSATDSADLAQMTACVYYKPGGLCRYGGDDPANVCVLGPCPHERTAEEVLADLARVTAERDDARATLDWFRRHGIRED